MKKIITFLMILLALNVITAQQPQPQSNNANNAPIGNLQGLKIAYITKQLNLNSEEAQKFWPVYYSCFDELRAVRQKHKNNAIAGDEEALTIKKKYYSDFKKILGTDERANKVFLVDRDFAAEVKKELEKRQQAKKQPQTTQPQQPQPNPTKK